LELNSELLKPIVISLPSPSSALLSTNQQGFVDILQGLVIHAKVTLVESRQSDTAFHVPWVVFSHRKIVSFCIFHFAQRHATVRHCHEIAEVRMFSGLLNRCVKPKGLLKQANVLQGISNLSEKIAVVKNAGIL
jgi:hypothetical protein